MARSPSTPLERALECLAGVLSTRQAARRWYESYLATLGPRAVVDSYNQGALTVVHRRAVGSQDVLPLPSVEWMPRQIGSNLLDGLQIHDGRQRLQILYDAEGRIADRSRDENFPGRLVELTRVITRAADGLAASVAFVAGLGDEQYGPGRVHYPLPLPGGVCGAWNVGLLGCRRALYEGRVPDTARFVVSDGLEGAAVGWGATREEAEAAYAACVARALPERRSTFETATDDYDDDGNLIARGELPPGLTEPGPPGKPSSYVGQPEPEEGEGWKSGSPEDMGELPPTPEVDPITGRVDFGSMTLRGPSSDAPEPPHRADFIPHVLIALDPPLDTPVPRGRWIRLLGPTGVTRHVLRIEERDGYLLVGSDLLGLVNLKSLRADLEAIDVRDPEIPGSAARERFTRFRSRTFRWGPATSHRPEGLASAYGSSGSRFDAGGMDGDVLQAMVYHHRRVPRPKG